MKDGTQLLLAGAVVSIVVWGFWRYTGEYGFLIMQAIVLFSLFADNYRLRKILRKHNISLPEDFRK